MATTFNAIMQERVWQPIPNCPGRYVLAGGPVAAPPDQIAVPIGDSVEHVVAVTKDPVIVTLFEDGGLISYRKQDGTYLHTLNTREGLERKLRQLGIW